MSAPDPYTPQTFERDERWTAVDTYAKTHLVRASDTPYYEGLNRAAHLSEQKGLPKIEVSVLQGKFLAVQCMLVDAKNILEVGTLGGYSAIWLASSGPETNVTTIEVDALHKAVAEEAIANAKLEERVKVILGAGNDVLPRMRKEVEDGTRPKFDFVFIDADKQNNLKYLNEAILMCRSRACIIVDNVVRKGLLASGEAAQVDSRVAGAREVVEAAGADHRLVSTLIQTVGEKNYDGFLLCAVK